MPHPSESFIIRPGRPEDVPALANLIRELAVYEKLEEHAKATPEALHTHLFGPRPCAETLLAEVAGAAVGFALFFTTFSTFRGQPGLYLEDLFVQEPFRRRGIGRAFFHELARMATERGYGRVEWSVLDWNTPAIGFYKSLGAAPMDDWTVYRLVDEPLRILAARAGEAERKPGV